MTVVVFIVASTVLGWMIGSSKGKAGAGLALGLLLGPLGVVIALFLKADAHKVESNAIKSGESKKCPFCSELIKVDAVVCRHCGRDLPVAGADPAAAADAAPAPAVDTTESAGNAEM